MACFRAAKGLMAVGTVGGTVKLLVTSSEDPASMNIRARLLERRGWSEKGSFDEHPAMVKDDFLSGHYLMRTE